MKMRSWSRIQAILLRGAVYLSAVLTAGILICLVIYILVKAFRTCLLICLASPILQKMYPCFRHLSILLR